jgi:hypothetical protein
MKKYNFLSIILLGPPNKQKKGENTLFTFDNSNFKRKTPSDDCLNCLF